MMKSYRVETVFKYSQDDAENELEEQFREFMKQNKMYDVLGPIVFGVSTFG